MDCSPIWTKREQKAVDLPLDHTHATRSGLNLTFIYRNSPQHCNVLPLIKYKKIRNQEYGMMTTVIAAGGDYSHEIKDAGFLEEKL